MEQLISEFWQGFMWGSGSVFVTCLFFGIIFTIGFAKGFMEVWYR